MTPEQAYEWLAPKLSTSERQALDVIYQAARIQLVPVGKVGEVPVLGGGVGYLDVPLPLGAVLYAEQI